MRSAIPRQAVTLRCVPLTITVSGPPTAKTFVAPDVEPERIARSKTEMSSAVAPVNVVAARVAPLPVTVAVPITSRLP